MQAEGCRDNRFWGQNIAVPDLRTKFRVFDVQTIGEHPVDGH